MEQLPSVKTHNPEHIARHHGVPLEVIRRQLQQGIEVEREHTRDPAKAREIALDHLLELPDYYTRLKKMEESDIQDILHRSGLAETKKSTLDKFETKVVDIALRLIDEDDDMDPTTAGMDILDAVNDKVMTESWERRAGTWYDPYKRALKLLWETLDEDAFADMKAKMAAQADAYLKQRDSSMSMATHDAGASKQPEPKKRVSMFGEVADQLEEITQQAIRDNYQIGREGIAKLKEIIATLTAQEEKVDQQQRGIFGRRKGKGRNKGNRRRWNIMSDLGEDAEINEMRRRAGITEETEHDLYTMLNTQRHILGTIIPELRGIAKNYVTDANAKQRLQEIAEQLASLQWKIHGERERGFGQAWTDVERQPTLWKDVK